MDDLSELAQLSLTSIGKIERGAQSPTTETLVRIACALDLSPGALISDLTPDDFGGRSHQVTARDLIRERERRRKSASGGGEERD